MQNNFDNNEMRDESEELIDHFLGMLISNLLYKESITSETIQNFTIEEIQEILRNPEKTRLWHTDGIRILTWESFLSLAQSILEDKYLPEQDKNIKVVGSIVIAYMALEECVNSFLQNCLLVQGFSYNEINEKLNRSLRDKLDGYLREITRHSLRTEKPELWGILIKAKNVRHPKVHNKVIPTFFAEEQYQQVNNPQYFKIASDFLRAIPLINDFLESCYTDEYFAINNELGSIWSAVKEKFGWKPGYSKKLIELIRFMNKTKDFKKNT